MLDVVEQCWIMLDGARGSLTLKEMLDVVGTMLDNAGWC